MTLFTIPARTSSQPVHFVLHARDLASSFFKYVEGPGPRLHLQRVQAPRGGDALALHRLRGEGGGGHGMGHGMLGPGFTVVVRIRRNLLKG